MTRFTNPLVSAVTFAIYASASIVFGRVDTDDKQVFALCQSDHVSVCAGQIFSPEETIDAGSFVLDGRPVERYTLTPSGPFNLNEVVHVQLKVEDSEGNSDVCNATVLAKDCSGETVPRRMLTTTAGQNTGSNFRDFCSVREKEKPVKVHAGHVYSQVVYKSSLVLLSCYYKCTKRRRRWLQSVSDILDVLPGQDIPEALPVGTYGTYPPEKSDPDFWYYRLPFNAKELELAKSAQFQYDGEATSCSNDKPFAVLGQPTNGTVTADIISSGCHAISMTLYDSKDCSGNQIGETAVIDLFGVALTGTVQLVVGDEKDGTQVDWVQELSTNEVTTLSLNYYKSRSTKFIVDPSIFPDEGGSLLFAFENGKTYCSNKEPYNSFGVNPDGTLQSKILPLGSHSVTVTQFTSNDCGSGAGNSTKFDFVISVDGSGNFTCPGQPSYIILYNAETDELVQPIQEDTTICLPDYKINFKAVVINCPRERVMSAKFEIKGAMNYTFVDRGPFFSAFGDDNRGDIFGMNVPPGPYTITVTTYSERDARGVVGGTYSVAFDLQDCNVSPIKCTAEVTGFQLRNKDGVVLEALPPIVSYAQIQDVALSIEALPKSCPNEQVQSMRLELSDGTTRCEKVGPYTLFGNRKGKVNVQTIPLAKIFQISATPYTSPDCTEGAGTKLIQQFVTKGADNTPNCPGEPVFFVLRDAASGAKLGFINDGDGICAPKRPFNIEAAVVACEGADIESTVFDLSGPSRRQFTDNQAPFFLYGDQGNDPNRFEPGEYNLTATPFLLPNGNGAAGGSLIVKFRVSKC